MDKYITQTLSQPTLKSYTTQEFLLVMNTHGSDPNGAWIRKVGQHPFTPPRRIPPLLLETPVQ